LHKEKTHRIDVFIPDKLWVDLRRSKSGITGTVTQALTQYLHNDTTNDTHGYSQDLYVKQILSENAYLRDSFSKMLNRATLPPSELVQGNPGHVQSIEGQEWEKIPLTPTRVTEGAKKKKRWWKGLFFGDRSTLD